VHRRFTRASASPTARRCGRLREHGAERDDDRRLIDPYASGDPSVVVADAGYWHQRQIETIVSDGIQVLVPPDSSLRRGTRPGWTGGLYDFMRRVRDPARPRALSPTSGDDRAGLRPAEVQPRLQTLPTPWPSGMPVGMAAHRGDAQPAQVAPPPPHSRDADFPDSLTRKAAVRRAAAGLPPGTWIGVVPPSPPLVAKAEAARRPMEGRQMPALPLRPCWRRLSTRLLSHAQADVRSGGSSPGASPERRIAACRSCSVR
jgi:hypothetical protein